MKSKIKSMLLACTMAVSCLPFSWTSANAATPDYSLWDKFIKYDLCITDYDSLTDTEKDLCHFIFDTEQSSDKPIRCERARRILAHDGNIGERITLEQLDAAYGICDRYSGTKKGMYMKNISYSYTHCVADIIGLDGWYGYNEYWLDDKGSVKVTEYYNEDKFITINCPNLQVGKLVFNEACAENVTVNIKSVPSDIMYSFAKFKSFTIGNNVKEVGFHFLESDRELNKNIVIPENVKIISSEGGHFPFSSVTVPASIEVFGAYDKASGSCMTDIEHSAKIPLLENKCIFDQDCTINGWYGTEAHSYAIEWGLKFNPLNENIAYGDLNADNSIDIADAVLMYSYISGHKVTVGFEADLTKDGIIDAFDMAAMRRNLIAILHTFT
ncbi:MAG: dockerin type I repeat-containing protein [Ruminococcus sp.]|nr:dockerin type I repeat-containing protein [Ruminococcus sp.]